MREYDDSGWKFWLGLFVGVAAGLYLNSEQGRRLRRDTGERLNQWNDELSEKARMEADYLSGRATENLQKSKEYADKARTALKEKVERASKAAEELIDRTEENYEKAADWATSKLENGKKAKK